MLRRSSLLALLVALVLLPASDSRAAPVRQPNSLALGLMIGNPLGISGKFWLGGSDAVDIGVGAGPGLRLQGSYLWGLAQLLSNPRDAQLDFYVGAGALVGGGGGYCGFYGRWGYHRCGGGAYVGARIPVGIDLRLREAPLSFALELAPGVALGADRAGALLDGILYARVVL